MITVANFFNKQHWEGEPVSIANFSPKGFRGERCSELAPGKIVRQFKKKQITQEEYMVAYKQQLGKLDVQEIGKRLRNKTLFCWEKTGEFCHRYIVADWLEDAGFEVKRDIDMAR